MRRAVAGSACGPGIVLREVIPGALGRLDADPRKVPLGASCGRGGPTR